MLSIQDVFDRYLASNAAMAMLDSYVIACCDELTEAAIPSLVNRWFPFIFAIDDLYTTVMAANKLWQEGRTIRVIQPKLDTIIVGVRRG